MGARFLVVVLVLGLGPWLTAAACAGGDGSVLPTAQPPSPTPSPTSAPSVVASAVAPSSATVGATVTPLESATASTSPSVLAPATPTPTAPAAATAPPATPTPVPPAPTPTPVPPSLPSAATVTGTAANRWSPGTVSVAAGGTVTWSWSVPVQPHDVTVSGLGSSGAPTKAGSFSLTFRAPGSYAFVCDVHPDMTGTVVVVG
ncbi:MAG: hypothetical protein IT304_05080 [Dehalococcoidia bacterium]|nr:hypothetical protein [Dehalococcoidia bacterium]